MRLLSQNRWFLCALASGVFYQIGTASSPQETAFYFRSAASALCQELEDGLKFNAAIQQRLKVVDVDASGNTALVESSQIFWVPTVVVYEGGRERRRLERQSNPTELRAFLDGKQLAQVEKSDGALAPDKTAKMDCLDDQPGDTNAGDLDIIRVCARVDDNKLKIRLDVSDPPSAQSAPRFNVFLDTDDDSATGYATASFQGADYLIQGANLYKFAGSSAQEWKFDSVGNATVEARGVSLHFTVALKQFSKLAREVKIWVGSQTPDWKPADWAPEGSPLVLPISGNASGPSAVSSASRTTPQTETTNLQSKPSEETVSKNVDSKLSSPSSPAEPAPASPIEGSDVAQWADEENDAPEAKLDLRSAKVAMTSDKLNIVLGFGASPVLSAIHVFIDADNSEQTGYSDQTRSGADFMIEGAGFFKHQSAQGTAWGWDKIGELTPAPVVRGNTVTFSIPRSRIGLAEGKKVKIWFAITDASWNTVDVFPDGPPKAYPER